MFWIPARAALAASLLLTLSFPVLADILRLKDGSVLNGTILRIEEKGIVIDTAFAGAIAVAHEMVEAVETGEMAAAADTVASAVTDPDPEPPARLWSAESEFGFSGASGNTDRLNFNGKIGALRETETSRLDLSLIGRFAREEGQKTENEIIQTSRYEQDFSPRWFIFGSLALERDDFEDLDLRSVATAGTGYFLIKREGHELKGRAGVGYQREMFESAPDEDEAVLSLGWDYRVRLNGWIRFTHAFTYLPGLSDPLDDFRLESDAGLAIPFTDDEAWKFRLSVRNHFDRAPVEGNRKLDTFYTLSLTYDFM